MNGRNNLALLLLMFLIALLLGCDDMNPLPPTPIPTPDYGCDSLWMDCLGTDHDYEICNNARDVAYATLRGLRYYSYVHCDNNVRTQLLPLADDCELDWR